MNQKSTDNSMRRRPGWSILIVVLFGSIALPLLLFSFSNQSFFGELDSQPTPALVPSTNILQVHKWLDEIQLQTANLQVDKQDELTSCLKLWAEKDAIFKANRNKRISMMRMNPKMWSNKRTFQAFTAEYPADMVIRIGSLDDGGKVLVNPFHLYTDRQCLAYSVGSNADFSFEEALLRISNRACEIHTFDPTLDPHAKNFMKMVSSRFGFEFHDAGFAGAPDLEGKYDTLQGFLTKLGHTNRTLDILKVDCEGCEYQFFPQVVEAVKEGRLEIGILNVELHSALQDFKAGPVVHQFFEWMDSIDMRLYSKDPNVVGCDGYKCSEFSWISAKEAFHSFVLYRCPNFSSDWEVLWTQIRNQPT